MEVLFNHMKKQISVLLWYIITVIVFGTFSMLGSQGGWFLPVPEIMLYIVFAVFLLPFLLFAYLHFWFRGREHGLFVRIVYYTLLPILYMWTLYVLAVLFDQSELVRDFFNLLYIINHFIAPIVLAIVLYICVPSTDQIRQNKLIRYTGYWVLMWPLLFVALIGNYGSELPTTFFAYNSKVLLEPILLSLMGGILVHNSSLDSNSLSLRNKYNLGILAFLLLITLVSMARTCMMYFERGYIL